MMTAGPVRRYYLDTEFDDKGDTTDLISIAIVSDDGRELYCVSDEFEPDSCNEWVRTNVLPQLPDVGLWMPRRFIAERIAAFVKPDPNIEIWTYYGSYDWVLTCRVFGGMMKMPQHFPQLTMDLKQLALSLGITESLKDLLPQPDGEHDALEDARWNHGVHDLLNRNLHQRK